MSKLSEKVLILGLDGMDPGLVNRFRAEGRMPNMDKYIQRGSSAKDLIMLGGVPTITPPMWTTLATGATPATHGITCFWGQSEAEMDGFVYNLNSHRCKAEQLWNITANEGLKTLVWHWPGSSWPPTSESENLHVVDGTQPTSIGTGDCIVDDDKLIVASKQIKELFLKPKVRDTSGAGCIITDIPDEESTNIDDMQSSQKANLILSEHDGDLSADMIPVDLVNSPITEPKKWEIDIPAKALEFSIIIDNGLMRYPALILCDEHGTYDKVAIYKNKKTAEPLAVLADKFVTNVIDDIIADDHTVRANRHMRLIELPPDGSFVKIWFSNALDIHKADLWHPQHLKETVIKNVGVVPPISMSDASNESLVHPALLPCWEVYVKWQAEAMLELIKQENYQVVFSHIHEIDTCGHLFWYLSKHRSKRNNTEKIYQDAIVAAYDYADSYIGHFLPLLDEGWTILIVSDHGLLVPPEEDIPLLGDGFGCNVRVMEKLGYTVLKQDEKGNTVIDYSKTRAVANRGNHIYLNLKGRYPDGIVDPDDKYALETQIISDLYNYRQDGKRVVSIALRNKDAAILGLSGEECGDILYWLEEGFNRLHGDSLPTFQGEYQTSVSPIFVAAGKGIKADFTTKRTIRITDVTPTVAAILGVAMPQDCEGAPIYQILDK